MSAPIPVEADNDSVELDISQRLEQRRVERQRRIDSQLQAAERARQPTQEEDTELFDLGDTLEQALYGVLRGGSETIQTAADLTGIEADVGEATGTDNLPEAESVSGAVVGGITQFVGPFLGFGKALKGVGFVNRTAKAIAAGGLADFAGFDPNEERLSDLAREYGLDNSLTRALEHDPNDSALEGRVKQTIEGGVLGLAGDLAVRGLMKGYRSRKAIQKARDAFDTSTEIRPTDFEYVGRLDKAASDLTFQRQRVDDIQRAHEMLLNLDEADPAFREARTYLTDGGDIESLSTDARQHVNLAELEQNAFDNDALAALNSRADAARELSPLTALDGEDPELAAKIRGYGIANADELEPGKLRVLLEEAKADHALAEQEWRKARVDPTFDTLPKEQRDNIELAVAESRRNPEDGMGTLQATKETEEEIARILKAEGRETIVEPKVLADGPKRRPLSTNVPIRLTGREAADLLKARVSGNAETAAGILADGHNTRKVLYTEEGTRAYFEHAAKDYQKATVTHAELKRRADYEVARWAATGRAVGSHEHLDELMSTLMPGVDGSLATKLLVYREVEASLASNANRLGQQLLAAGADASTHLKVEYLQAAEGFLNFNDARRTLRKDIARAQASNRIKVFDGEIDAETLRQGLADKVSPLALARKMQAAGNDPAALAAISKWTKAKDAAYGVWINGLLSGPLTHAVNFISNGAVAVWNPTERFIGSVVSDAVRREFDFPGAREAAESFKDLLTNWEELIRLTGRAFESGESQLTRGINQLEHSSASGPLAAYLDEGAASSGYGRTVGSTLNTIFGLPGKLLVTGDEFFKGINFNVEARRQARRHLRSTNPDLTGAEFDLEVTRLANDSLHWEEDTLELSASQRATRKMIHDRAIEAARRNTFTNDLNKAGETTFGGTLQQATTNHPTLRLVMPFVRTPTNLFRYAMDRTPVLALVWKRNREEIAQALRNGDRDAAASAAGKQMGGLMVAGTVANMAINGRATGGGPSNPAQRKQWLLTHQPYSIRMGDQWIQYNRLDPLGMIMGLTADITEMSGELEQDEYNEMIWGVAASVIKNLASKRYMSGIFEAMRAVDSGDPDIIGSFARRTAGSVVPNFFAQTNRALLDSTLRQRSDGLSGWIDEAKSRIPGLSSTLEPRLNLFGEEIQVPPGYRAEFMQAHSNGQLVPQAAPSLVIPFQNREISTNDTRNHLTEIGFDFDMRAFDTIGGVQLTPKQKNRVIKIAANGLEDRITRLVNAPGFKERLTYEGQNEKIKQLIAKRVQTAEGILRSEDRELNATVVAKQKAQQLSKTVAGEEALPGLLDALGVEL